MENNIEQYIYNILSLKQNNPFMYLAREANCYYEVEDTCIFPKVANSSIHQEFVEALKKYKNPLTGLKNLMLPLFEKFELADIKIKVTQCKNGESYYHPDKNIIFLNKSLLADATCDSDDCYYDILVVTLLHEFAHAYTNLFYDKYSEHNNVFLVVFINILSTFLQEDESYFYDVQLDYDNGNFCPPLKSIIKEQMFLTGNKFYVNEFFVKNEEEKKQCIESFFDDISKKEANNYFEKVKGINLSYFTKNEMDCYQLLNEDNVDLISMRIIKTSSGFKIFQFNKIELFLDEIEQIYNFKNENSNVPQWILDSCYK